MTRTSDEIDFRIIGDDMQAVVITLDPEEQVIAEAGAMMYMTDGIDMQTTMSAGQGRGMLGKLMKAAGRMVTGESFFVTTFTNEAQVRADVAFSAPYPGKILPIDLDEQGRELVCQKDAFLCAARGTELSVAFQKRIGAGLFGGEGFILQRLQGDGLAFVHAGGTVFRMPLEAGQKLRLDSGCLVAMQPSVDYDIQWAGGFKNALFGGEGLFLATLTGPGNVWLQTLPFSRLADRMMAAGRSLGRKSTGEGSILGGLFMGDND